MCLILYSLHLVSTSGSTAGNVVCNDSFRFPEYMLIRSGPKRRRDLSLLGQVSLSLGP